MKKKIVIVLCALAVIVVAVLAILYLRTSNEIISVVVTTPNNTANYDQIQIRLAKAAPAYIEYEEEKTGKRFRTRTSPTSTTHSIDLLLLKANTKYTYRIYVGKYMPHRSAKMTFTTREQSSWLQNHWLSPNGPHDAQALGNGMVLICNARLPGYIMIIDGEGQVRWYWQIEGIGVRSACLTPRGTILCMLRPFSRDVRDYHTEETLKGQKVDENKKPQRRGPIGFVGGTEFCEVTLTGKMLWRLNLKQVEKDPQYQVIHHDFFMDKQGLIHTLFRPDTVITVNMPDGSTKLDTLNGDGFMVIDSLGHVRQRWSAWEHWDMKSDPYMDEYGHDRFHANGLYPTPDGNYLFSVAIEDQIWKINAKTGKVMWKFGKNGDFKMNPKDYFSFQHTPNLTADGELMLFDNGLYTQQSAVKCFKLDEKNMTAETTLSIQIPRKFYSSRMGSAYLLPNGNVLISCAKSGGILVTDKQGKILWESLLYFAPYRAVYVPDEVWRPYFKPLN